jgi:hypothetical protein
MKCNTSSGNKKEYKFSFEGDINIDEYRKCKQEHMVFMYQFELPPISSEFLDEIAECEMQDEFIELIAEKLKQDFIKKFGH